MLNYCGTYGLDRYVPIGNDLMPPASIYFELWLIISSNLYNFAIKMHFLS